MVDPLNTPKVGQKQAHARARELIVHIYTMISGPPDPPTQDIPPPHQGYPGRDLPTRDPPIYLYPIYLPTPAPPTERETEIDRYTWCGIYRWVHLLVVVYPTGGISYGWYSLLVRGTLPTYGYPSTRWLVGGLLVVLYTYVWMLLHVLLWICGPLLVGTPPAG